MVGPASIMSTGRCEALRRGRPAASHQRGVESVAWEAVDDGLYTTLTDRECVMIGTISQVSGVDGGRPR